MNDAILIGNMASYRIIGDLGGGYFAKVYRAEVINTQNPNLPSQVALKVLWNGESQLLIDQLRDSQVDLTLAYPIGISDREKQTFERDFKKERGVFRYMSKTPVAYTLPELYEEVDIANQPKFYAMEWIDSSVFCPVTTLLQNGPLDEPTVLMIMRDYVAVLTILHEEIKIVNRDLQIQNLYWSEDDRLLKALDWNGVSNQGEDIPIGEISESLRILIKMLYQMLTTRTLPKFVFAFHLETTAVKRWQEITPQTQELIRRWLLTPIRDEATATKRLLSELTARLDRWNTSLSSLLSEMQQKLALIQQRLVFEDAENIHQIEQHKLDYRDIDTIIAACHPTADVVENWNSIRQSAEELFQPNFRLEGGIRSFLVGRVDLAKGQFERIQYLGLPVERWLRLVSVAQGDSKAFTNLRIDYPDHFQALVKVYKEIEDWKAIHQALEQLPSQVGVTKVSDGRLLWLEAQFHIEKEASERNLSTAGETGNESSWSAAEKSTRQALEHGQDLIAQAQELELPVYAAFYQPMLDEIIIRLETITRSLDSIKTLKQHEEKLDNAFTTSLDAGLHLLSLWRESYLNTAEPAVWRVVNPLVTHMAEGNHWEDLNVLLKHITGMFGGLTVEGQRALRQWEYVKALLVFKKYLRERQYQFATELGETILSQSYLQHLPQVLSGLRQILLTHFKFETVITVQDLNRQFEQLGDFIYRIDDDDEELRQLFDKQIRQAVSEFVSSESLDQLKLDAEMEQLRQMLITSFKQRLDMSYSIHDLLNLRDLAANLQQQKPDKDVDALLQTIERKIGNIYNIEIDSKLAKAETPDDYSNLLSEISRLPSYVDKKMEAKVRDQDEKWGKQYGCYLQEYANQLEYRLRTFDDREMLFGVNIKKLDLELNPIREKLADAKSQRRSSQLVTKVESLLIELTARINNKASTSQSLRHAMLEEYLSFSSSDVDTLLNYAEKIEPFTRTGSPLASEWQSKQLAISFENAAREIKINRQTYATVMMFYMMAERIQYIAQGNTLQHIPDNLTVPAARDQATTRYCAYEIAHYDISLLQLQALLEQSYSEKREQKSLEELEDEKNLQLNALEETIQNQNGKIAFLGSEKEKLTKQLLRTRIGVGILGTILVIALLISLVSNSNSQLAATTSQATQTSQPTSQAIPDVTATAENVAEPAITASPGGLSTPESTAPTGD